MQLPLTIVKPRYLRKLNLKYALLGLLTFLLVLLGSMTAGWAQDVEGSLGWKSFGLEGDVAYVSIRLDGYDLFTIAAARSKEGGGRWGLGTVQLRRNRIENLLKSQLQELIARELQGWTQKISVHLCRGPEQTTEPGLQAFYPKILAGLRLGAVRNGDWQLLECKPAWEGNWTWDCFIAFGWQGADGPRAIADVNYAPNQSQCYIPLLWSDISEQTYQLKDLMGADNYERSGDSLLSPGLYLDLPAWGYQVFQLIQLR